MCPKKKCTSINLIPADYWHKDPVAKLPESVVFPEPGRPVTMSKLGF